jgi:putative DNA primase/helicase
MKQSSGNMEKNVRPSLREVAEGKWRGILVALGFDDNTLDGKHRPCPACGGIDRWRFDDKGGNGSSYCSQCGATDGVGLVMKCKGYDFKTAAVEIERVVGFVKPGKLRAAQSDASKIDALRRMWQESRPVAEGDEVSLYLVGRGLPAAPGLRFHAGLSYREGDETGRYPAMLALIQAPDGSGASIHRTYLKDGKKAPVSKPKKIMPGLPISGGAVRLSPADRHLGIAEGIETALRASVQFSVPVWAAISAGGMESWVPPEGVESVTVFGDNDENFVGQKAAFVLAHRLALKGIKVDVWIPSVVDTDWADL